MANFYDEEIVIDFPLPTTIQYSIEECEKADAENNLGAYLNYAEMVAEVLAKNAYGAGVITKEQWVLLQRKYHQ